MADWLDVSRRAGGAVEHDQGWARPCLRWVLLHIHNPWSQLARLKSFRWHLRLWPSVGFVFSKMTPRPSIGVSQGGPLTVSAMNLNDSFREFILVTDFVQAWGWRVSHHFTFICKLWQTPEPILDDTLHFRLIINRLGFWTIITRILSLKIWLNVYHSFRHSVMIDNFDVAQGVAIRTRAMNEGGLGVLV